MFCSWFRDDGRKPVVPLPVVRWGLLLLFVFVMVLTAAHRMGRPYVYWNTTRSAPLGLYVYNPSGGYRPGDYVIYRTRKDYGNMPEGTFILKRVVGFPGDVYVRGDGYLEIGDKRYKVFTIPGLPQVPLGTYIIPAGQYLLLNETERSFDGRYIGPVEGKDIVRKVSLAFDRDAFARKEDAFYRFLVRHGICDGSLGVTG